MSSLRGHLSRASSLDRPVRPKAQGGDEQGDKRVGTPGWLLEPSPHTQALLLGSPCSRWEAGRWRGRESGGRGGRARSQTSVCAPAGSKVCTVARWLPWSFVGCEHCHRGGESRSGRRKPDASRKLCYISFSEPVSQHGSEEDLGLQEFVIVTCLS